MVPARLILGAMTDPVAESAVRLEERLQAGLRYLAIANGGALAAVVAAASGAPADFRAALLASAPWFGLGLVAGITSLVALFGIDVAAHYGARKSGRSEREVAISLGNAPWGKRVGRATVILAAASYLFFVGGILVGLLELPAEAPQTSVDSAAYRLF